VRFRVQGAECIPSLSHRLAAGVRKGAAAIQGERERERERRRQARREWEREKGRETYPAPLLQVFGQAPLRIKEGEWNGQEDPG